MRQMAMFETDASAFTNNPIPPIASKARTRLEEIINGGRASAKRVLDHVESLQPIDKLAKVNKLEFELATNKQGNNVLHMLLPDDTVTTLHRNALGQAAERAKIPMAFAQHLLDKGDWGIELLASNFNELFGHLEERALIRIVGDDARGFLSDRYRRLDSRPLVDAFARSCTKVGALPYKGYVTDTKIGLQAIIPKVYEPIPDEVMAYGVNFENSDFGNGALNVSFFLLRLVCLNGMIGETSMRQVHLGKRLDENIEWSEKTYKLDMQTVVSGMGDMVLGQLAETRIEEMQAQVRRAHAAKLDDNSRRSVLDMLKRFMNKGELDKTLAKFNEPDVEMLPAGNNLWRMSNAISWLAGEEEDEERKLEVQRLAGKVLPS